MRKLGTRNVSGAENFFFFLNFAFKESLQNVTLIVFSTMCISPRGNSHGVSRLPNDQLLKRIPPTYEVALSASRKHESTKITLTMSIMSRASGIAKAQVHGLEAGHSGCRRLSRCAGTLLCKGPRTPGALPRCSVPWQILSNLSMRV